MRSTSDLVRTAIRVEIARQGITQSAVVAVIEKSPAWLSQRLSGETAVSLDDLDVIATGLGITPTDLLNRALAEISVGAA